MPNFARRSRFSMCLGAVAMADKVVELVEPFVLMKSLISVLVGVGVTVVLFILGGSLGGACHCMTPMTVFFPYGTIITMRSSWESIGLLVTVLQFPLYAVILAAASGGKKRYVVLGALVAVHASAVIVGLKVFHL